MQAREAARINAFLERGGRIEFGLGPNAREIEHAVAVGISLVFAFTDGTEKACGHFGSMSGGYSLRWVAA